MAPTKEPQQGPRLEGLIEWPSPDQQPSPIVQQLIAREDDERRRVQEMLHRQVPETLDDANPYRGFSDELRRRDKLGAVIALDEARRDPTTAAQHARVQRISDDTGLPRDVVQRYADELEKDQRYQGIDIDGMARHNPELTKFMPKVPAEMVLDDLEDLAKLEWLFKVPGNALRWGAYQMELGYLAGQQSTRAREGWTFPEDEQIERRLQWIEQNIMPHEFGEESFLGTGYVEALKMAPYMGSTLAAAVGGGGIGAGIGAGVGGAPGAMAGATIGARAAAFFNTYWVEKGFAWRELKDMTMDDGTKLDPVTGAWISEAIGIANGMFEMAGLTLVMGPFKKPMQSIVRRITWNSMKSYLKKKGWLAALRTDAMRQLGTKQRLLRTGGRYLAATLGETGTEWAQELTVVAGREIATRIQKGEWGEEQEDIARAWGETVDVMWKVFPAMVLTGGVASTFGAISDVRGGRRTIEAVNHMQALTDTQDGVELRDTAPDKYEDLIKAYKEHGDVRDVSIPVGQWTRVLSEAGLDPAQEATSILGDDQYSEAMEDGGEGDLVIPIEKYLTQIAPTPLHALLKDDVKLFQGQRYTHREWKDKRDDILAHVKETLGKDIDVATLDKDERYIFEAEQTKVIAATQDAVLAESAAMFNARVLTRLARKAAKDPKKFYDDLQLEYVQPNESPELKTATGEALHHQEAVHDVLSGVLNIEPNAIEAAAADISEHIEAEDLVVPLPDPSGSAQAAAWLAQLVARDTGAKFDPRLLSRIAGKPGVAPGVEVSKEAARAAELPAEGGVEGEKAGLPKRVVFIDVMRRSGKRIAAAQKLVPGSRYIAFAQGDAETIVSTEELDQIAAQAREMLGPGAEAGAVIDTLTGKAVFSMNAAVRGLAAVAEAPVEDVEVETLDQIIRDASPTTLFRSVSVGEAEDFQRTGVITGRGGWFSGDPRGLVWFGDTINAVMHHGEDTRRAAESSPEIMAVFKEYEELHKLAVEQRKKIQDLQVRLRGRRDPDTGEIVEKRDTTMTQAQARTTWRRIKTLGKRYQETSDKAKATQGRAFKMINEWIGRHREDRMTAGAATSFVLQFDAPPGGTRFTGRDSLSGNAIAVSPADEVVHTDQPITLDETVREVARRELTDAPHDVLSSIESAAQGVVIGAQSDVDRWFDEKLSRRLKLDPQVMYDAFTETRRALRDAYGDTITLWRLETPGRKGKIRSKHTLNYVLSKKQLDAFTEFYRDDVGEERVVKQVEVPVDNIISVNVGTGGGYEEFIVLNEKSTGRVDPAPDSRAETGFKAEEVTREHLARVHIVKDMNVIASYTPEEFDGVDLDADIVSTSGPLYATETLYQGIEDPHATNITWEGRTYNVPRYMRGGPLTKGKLKPRDAAQVEVAKVLEDFMLIPGHDEHATIEEALEWGNNTTYLKPLVITDELQELRYDKPNELGHYGNEKIAFANKVFKHGRNTWDIVGCGRARWAVVNGQDLRRACYTIPGKEVSACYVDVELKRHGGKQASVATGVRKRAVPRGRERTKIARYVRRNGMPRARVKFPLVDIQWRQPDKPRQKVMIGQIEKMGLKLYKKEHPKTRKVTKKNRKEIMVLGLEEAKQKRPDWSIRETTEGELVFRMMSFGKFRNPAGDPLKVIDAETAQEAAVSTQLEPANGQDIRLGIDTDGGAWLVDERVMDAILDANPRTLTVFTSAYHEPPAAHPLSGRSIINVTVSGWQPIGETMSRLRYAEAARAAGWNVILREVTADERAFGKETADMYNRIHEALLHTDFMIMQQPLHLGTTYGKPIWGLPGCCSGSEENERTCDACEVAEGLGRAWQKYWDLAEDGRDSEIVLPDVPTYRGRQLYGTYRAKKGKLPPVLKEPEPEELARYGLKEQGEQLPLFSEENLLRRTNRPRHAPIEGPSGTRVLGKSLSEKFEEAGFVDLRGQQVNGPEDLALLGRVFRDPRFETFRIFWMKKGKIIAQEAGTIRMPGVTKTLIGTTKPEVFVSRMVDRAERLRADGIYFMHNHPSGRVDPSPEDILSTAGLVTGMISMALRKMAKAREAGVKLPKQVAKDVAYLDGLISAAASRAGISRLKRDMPGDASVINSWMGNQAGREYKALKRLAKAGRIPIFEGHVIIDHEQFTNINQKLMPVISDIPQFVGTQDPLVVPEVESALLGEEVLQPAKLATAGRAVASSNSLRKGYVALFFLSTQGSIRAVEEVPEKLFRSADKLANHIRGRIPVYGAGATGYKSFVAAYTSDASLRTVGKSLIRRDVLVDMIIDDPSDPDAFESVRGIPGVQPAASGWELGRLTDSNANAIATRVYESNIDYAVHDATRLWAEETYGQPPPRKAAPEDFHRIADQQRGRPERAAMTIQRTQIAQLYGFVAEHVGDLIHRMTEQPTLDNGGFDAVAPKIRKTLNAMRGTRSFSSDVDDQIEANVAYITGRHMEQQENLIPDDMVKMIEDSGAEVDDVKVIITNEEYKGFVQRYGVPNAAPGPAEMALTTQRVVFVDDEQNGKIVAVLLGSQFILPSVTVEGATERLKSLGRKYADLHLQLPTYNEAQLHAQAAAVAVGLFDFPTAIWHLEELEKHITSVERWTAYARRGLAGQETEARMVEKCPAGECFRNVNRYGMDHDEISDVVVVHGKVTNVEGKTFAHAWVESGGRVIDPTQGVSLPADQWYALLKAVPESKYTSEQAMVNMARTGNHGPWTSEEVGDRTIEKSEWIEPETLGQDEEEDRRGYLTIKRDLSGKMRKAIIGLTDKWDPSTLFHEPAHVYLELIRSLDEEEDATAAVKADAHAIRKFLGITRWSQLTGEKKEMFSDGWEQYLREGKSPSEDLRPIFARIKAWMLAVYGQVKDIVTLTPEIRRVFDRMLASDEEIDAARRQLALEPLPGTRDGMDAEQLEALDAKIQEANDRAKAEISSGQIADVQEAGDWVRNNQEQIEQEVLEEFKKSPVMRVLYFLQKGKRLDTPEVDETLKSRPGKDGKPLKLSRQLVLDRYGWQKLRGLPRSPYVYTSVDEYATDPDYLARKFKFESGQDLVDQLQGQMPYTKAFKEAVDRRIEQRFGEIVAAGQEAFMDALDATQNESEVEALLIEIRYLRRTLRPEEWKNKRMPFELADLKYAAAQRVAKKKVAELRPHQYKQAAQRHGTKAFDLAGRGKMAEAYDQRVKQAWNMIMYRTTRDAVAEVDKIVSLTRRLQQMPAQRRLGKAGWTYRAQVNELLEKFSFRPESRKATTRRQSLRAFIDRSKADGNMAHIDERLEDMAKTHYNELSMETMRSVRDTLLGLQHLASMKLGIIIEGRRRDYKNTVDALVASGNANIPGKSKWDADEAAKRIRDIWVERVRHFDAGLLGVEEMVERLDGRDIEGPWTQYWWTPIAEAQAKEADMRVDILVKLAEMFEEVPKAERERMMSPEKSIKIEALGGKMITRQLAIVIGLNWGNEGNRSRVMEGGAGLTNDDAAWAAAVPEILNNLTAAELKLIQRTWDILQSLWPHVVELEERVNGYAPDAVERTPFTMTSSDGIEVEMQGGYYPIIYSPTSNFGRQQEDEAHTVPALYQQGASDTIISHPWTKKRADVVRKPLRMRFDLIIGHVNQVIHDVTHREAVLNAHRLLNDDRVSAMVYDRMGEQYFKALNQRLLDIAGTMRNIENPLNPFLAQTRMNLTVVAMGFKASVSLQNISNFGLVLERIKVKYLRDAVAEFTRATMHPRTELKKLIEEVQALSPHEMRHRFNTLERDIRESLEMAMKETITAGKTRQGVLETRKFAFGVIAATDALTAYPAWLAAYRQAKDEGKSERSAGLWADRVVRTTLSAGGKKDIASIQAGGEPMKIYTMFWGFFRTSYMRHRALHFDIRTKRWKEEGSVHSGLPWALARIWCYWFVPAVLGELLAGRGPEEPDELSSWLKWIALKFATYPFMAVPLVRDAAGRIEGALTGGYSRPIHYGPVGTVMEEVWKAGHKLADELNDPSELDAKTIARSVNIGMGYLVGLPARQIDITGSYLWDMMTGEEQPESVAEFAHHVLFWHKREAERGRRRPRKPRERRERR